MKTLGRLIATADIGKWLNQNREGAERHTRHFEQQLFGKGQTEANGGNQRVSTDDNYTVGDATHYHQPPQPQQPSLFEKLLPWLLSGGAMLYAGERVRDGLINQPATIESTAPEFSDTDTVFELQPFKPGSGKE